MSTNTNNNNTISKNHPLYGIHQSLGPKLLTQIQQHSKILLIGSGGIGCELLKNLALSGFRNVDVVDLDTIDVSNLNRQFLFRSQHVGMAKCKVACEVALKMVPPPLVDGGGEGKEGGMEEVRYTPHHGNVCDATKFNVPYLSQFNLVLNALDNVTARRRVNRLCLAASIPLVEAGTTGYLGQVTVIDKQSATECYECQTKPTQKVYPICTIRSTPTMPVHTIVWGKELYKLIFGSKVEDSMLFEGMDDDDEESGEPSTYMDGIMELRTMLESSKAKAKDENPKKDNDDENGTKMVTKVRTLSSKVLTALYNTEIQKQINTKRYETAEKKPIPLTLTSIQSGTVDTNKVPPPTKRNGYKATDVWTVEECISEFTSCLLDATTTQTTPILSEFDKDDALAMRFVTSTSNLRSYVFQITPIQSYYHAKGIAGNIIPAIATTNAIVAGLQVLQVFHILRTQMESKMSSKSKQENEKEETTAKKGTLKTVCKYTYCNRDKTRRGYYLLPTTLPDPNPNCFVCKNATLPLKLNLHNWTLQTLLQKIIKTTLGFVEPTILLNGDIIHEEGDGADTELYGTNLNKKLKELPCGGICHGSVVRVEDFTQNLEVDVMFTHVERWEDDVEGGEGKDEEEDEFRFVVGGEKPQVTKEDGGGGGSTAAVAAASAAPNGKGTESSPPPPPAAASASNGGPAAAEEDDDDDDDVIEVMEEPIEDKKLSSSSSKRPASEVVSNGDDGGSAASPLKKKGKYETDGANDDDGKDNKKEIEIIELD